MNISKKTLLSFGASTFLLCTLVGLIIYFVVLPGFKAVGEENHKKNYQQKLIILNHTLQSISDSMADWSVWDDMYFFVTQPHTRKTFAESNLTNQGVEALNLDLVSIWDENKKLLLLRFDPNNSKQFLVFDKNQFNKILDPYSAKLFPQDEKEIVLGFINSPTGVLFICSRPIYKTDHLSTSSGRLIFGRFINTQFQKELQEIVGNDFIFKPLEDKIIKANQTVNLNERGFQHLNTTNINNDYHYHLSFNQQKKSKNKFIFSDLVLFYPGEKKLNSIIMLEDFGGKPLYGIEYSEPRDWYLMTVQRMELFYLIFIGVALLFAVSNIFIIDQWVIKRLKGLGEKVLAIRNGDATELNFEVSARQDELDNLAENMQDMLFKIHQNEELIIQSKLEAERASISKTHFLANMSHEIRTPLHSMLGALDLVQYTDLTQEQKQLLEISLVSGKTLLEILGDILDFSKIESGEIELNKINFDLREMLHEVELLKRQVCQEKGLEFFIEDEINLPCEVEVDAVRLKQVIVNLISNARKYTKEGSVTLKVKANLLNDQLAHVFVSVADTGIGISKDKMRRVFDRFYQVDENSKKRIYGGVGLGLSISQAIINRMDGEIQVDSVVNKGSTFWFSLKLPLAQKTFCPLNYNNLDIQNKIFPTISTLSNNDSGKSTILVVDDQALNRTVMQKFFVKLGLDCDLATGGQEAVDLCAKTRYDLIFMDIQMPEIDGIQASRLIKWQEKGVKPVIVALTANTSSADIKYYLDSGFNDFLGKPVSLCILREHLEKLQNQYGLNLMVQSNPDKLSQIEAS